MWQQLSVKRFRFRNSRCDGTVLNSKDGAVYQGVYLQPIRSQGKMHCVCLSGGANHCHRVEYGTTSQLATVPTALSLPACLPACLRPDV